MGIFAAAGLLGRAAFGGSIRRMITGGLLGGAIGGGTSNANTSTGTMRDVVSGAVMGLGIGGLTSGLARRVALGVKPGAGWIKNSGNIVSRAWGMGSIAAKGGYKAARFVNRNPRTAIGIGIGGASLYGLSQSGYGELGGGTREMSALALRQGTPSTGYTGNMGLQPPRMISMPARYKQLQQSTHNLVQGLHQGRHR